jgi:hypothetical protein
MNYNAYVDPVTRKINQAAIAAGTAGVTSGARWFSLIALLALADVALRLGAHRHDLGIGLGLATTAAHAFGARSPTALAVAFLVPAFLVLVGRQARGGRFWFFIIGALVYTVDALVCLHFRDKLAVGLHVVALAFILRGAFALRAAVVDAEIAAMEHPERAPRHPAPPPAA